MDQLTATVPAGPGRSLVSYPDLARAILALPAGAGRYCRVVAVDGYSGSGKGFFAARLAAALGTQPLNTDDLVRGWDGLAESIDLLIDGVLRPAAQGLTGRWRRYDWDRLALAEWVEVPPRPVLVVEGCGVGVRRAAPYLSCLVWVDAPAGVRRRRLARRADWEMYRPYAAMWARQEGEIRAGEQIPERADVFVDNAAEAPAHDADRQFAWRPRPGLSLSPGAAPDRRSTR
jgi:cytidylate kinase